MAIKYVSIFAAPLLSVSLLIACQVESEVPNQTASLPALGYVDSGCFVTAQTSLSAGDSITVQDIASGGLQTATIKEANISGNLCGTFQTMQARAADPDLHFHSLSEPLDYAVAWETEAGLKSTMNDLIYSSCTTGEGLRYRAVNASSGDVVWEGYQPLGYDTQSDCTE